MKVSFKYFVCRMTSLQMSHVRLQKAQCPHCVVVFAVDDLRIDTHLESPISREEMKKIEYPNFREKVFFPKGNPTKSSEWIL